MATSPADAVLGILDDVSQELSSACRSNNGATAVSDLQLRAENAVARGIAVLAGEAAPLPATDASGRQILARDLLITLDLVARALKTLEP